MNTFVVSGDNKVGVSVQAITQTPGVHWGGYYDKLHFSQDSRFVLGMKGGFDCRSPRLGESVEIGIVDLVDGFRWQTIGLSRAWCWQQGCMLQWLPSARNTVLWNDRLDGRLVCTLLDLASGDRRTIPTPIYTVSPNGRRAITTDFRRINDMRPGYGYAGDEDPYRDQLAPEQSGIWSVDMATGETRLIVSIADVARIPLPGSDLSAAKHYFNHLLFNPDGERFVFLHRWRFGKSWFKTRMLSANADGSNLQVLDDSGYTSHFIWRDAKRLVAFSKRESFGEGFFEFDVTAGEEKLVLPTANDGHCLFLPGGDWMLCDTYPLGSKRVQSLGLVNWRSLKSIPLGDFTSPSEYEDEWRCDLHARVSSDGRFVVFDSAHGGNGRQMHLLDLSGLNLARHE